MNVTRIRHPEIKAIQTAMYYMELYEGQCWYTTPKAYEIWQETPDLRFIKRIPKSRVYWVDEK